jgi:negative modulator of initiation of replication
MAMWLWEGSGTRYRHSQVPLFHTRDAGRKAGGPHFPSPASAGPRKEVLTRELNSPIIQNHRMSLMEENMPTIQIEDKAYDVLDCMAKSSGESHADIVWRLLLDAIKTHIPQQRPTGASAALPAKTENAAIVLSPLEEFLKSPRFLAEANVVQRFLAILSWLYKQNQDKFDKVTTLRGTNRLYFAKTAEELEDKGKSVNPKHVPDAPYWVVTNSPTEGKKDLLSHVMRVLGYDPSSIQIARQALR